jgi:hypothetical protein
MANQEAGIAPARPDMGLRQQQRVAAVAYQFWLARVFRNGSPEEDWLRADKLVRGGVGPVTLRQTPVGNYLMS